MRRRLLSLVAVTLAVGCGDQPLNEQPLVGPVVSSMPSPNDEITLAQSAPLGAGGSSAAGASGGFFANGNFRIMGDVGIGPAVAPANNHILTMSRSLGGLALLAVIENNGFIAAAGVRLKTGAAGNDWSVVSQDDGAGNARGFEVQHAILGTKLLINPSTGFVGINNVGPADQLDVVGDIRVGSHGTDGCVKDRDATVIAGVCSSDERLKKNITSLPSLLSRVTRLRPVYFNWRSDEFPERVLGDETQLGLIAQEVERILPELVVEGDDGFKRVRYNDLPMLLLQAIKEQQRENEDLRTRVANLETTLHWLEAAVAGIHQ